jgi:hypothetical protein
MKRFIRIEPRKSYDKAIVRKLKSGKLVYSFNKLVQITMDEYSISNEDAKEWVDFHIIAGLNNSSYSFFGICYR